MSSASSHAASSLAAAPRLLAALAAPSVARAQTQTLAHGDLMAEAPARARHVGRARRRAHRARCPAAACKSPCHAAGEVVPAFEVLDAVGGGVAEIGHTASFYWQGKMPAAAFFTTVPFGLTPDEHVAWVEAGGGQALWDELYAPFGVKPFMGGNTGVCMGGWFRREIESARRRARPENPLARARRRGLSPARRHAADDAARRNPHRLQSGVLDAAEFVGPGTDIALGLYRVAPFYYGPGFNKPNGTGECIVSLKAWDALDAELKAIVAHACAAEATFALAEMERLNAEALAALIEQHSVQLRELSRPTWSPPARKVAADVLGELGGAQRRRAQGARFLRGVPRPHRAVVARVDQGGAGGARKLR